MRSWKMLLIAAPIAMGLLAAPAAEAHWRGDWHGGYGWHHHDDGGAVAGAIIGLGVGALVGGAIAASQPHYYAPPAPVYYAPPGYAQY
jgi:hypothetical protein